MRKRASPLEKFYFFLAAFCAFARRDFIRAALFLWITPDFAALSKTEAHAGVTAFTSSVFPDAMAVLAAFAAVFTRLRTARFRFAAAADLRMFFCADLIFAISVFDESFGTSMQHFLGDGSQPRKLISRFFRYAVKSGRK